jgi:hypothetical protein
MDESELGGGVSVTIMFINLDREWKWNTSIVLTELLHSNIQYVVY